MKTLIEGYQSFPGEHCGSVAMRGLLHHYCGLDLPEAAVFGLGAGLGCIYLASPQLDPAALLFGRTASMEVDLGGAFGLDYREQPEADDAYAWEVVCDEVMAGRPTMLSGDIFYLDYREFKVHFPAHRFVLVGFDDATKTAYIADRIRPEPEACSYAALFASRNPPEGISTHNLWGRFHDTQLGRELPEAMRFAIDLCARRMLGREATGLDGIAEPEKVEMVTGVQAIHRFAEVLPGWAERDDMSWLASYNARCIEKFGNGGGNFRRLYAGFLHWARNLDAATVPERAPDLALAAADGWTALAAKLGAAADGAAGSELWRDAASEAHRIAGIETALFESLAERVSQQSF
jgi:hypothetical protein